MDLQIWNQQQRRLKQMVKTLKKNTKLSELHKLDLEHRGVLIAFWREYGNEPNFVNWMTSMEKKDPDWNDYIESYHENKEEVKPEPKPVEDIIPEEPEDNIIENKELSITEKIQLIREKYGNID